MSGRPKLPTLRIVDVHADAALNGFLAEHGVGAAVGLLYPDATCWLLKPARGAATVARVMVYRTAPLGTRARVEDVIRERVAAAPADRP